MASKEQEKLVHKSLSTLLRQVKLVLFSASKLDTHRSHSWSHWRDAAGRSCMNWRQRLETSPSPTHKRCF